MPGLEPVRLPWLVEFVNEFAPQTRAAAGEESTPYPDIWNTKTAPRRPRVSEQKLVDVAERLWETFAGDESQRSGTLNALLRASSLSPWTDHEGQLRWRTADLSAADRLLAACTAALLEAVIALGWPRLGVCAGQDCLDIYIDADGRGSRRYCSHECLNRARVRAYRSRQNDRLRRRRRAI